VDIGAICILGGSGFVGRSIADQACARGLRVRVLSRSRTRTRPLTVLPTVEIMVGDPRDEATLGRALEGMDAAVNLVGILHEGAGRSFSAVHAELARKVVRACQASGVGQLLHMSALGAAEDAPSAYLRSKAGGEAAVREAVDAPHWTIFRPSVVFGQDDRFLNLFATLVRLFSVIPLGAAHARFRPIWVEDVARCFVRALGDARVSGRSYDLCGPRAYSLGELVEFVARTLGRRRWIVPLPDALARMQAAVLEHLPGQLMTRDNLRSMSVDNVCTGAFPEVFGFAPAALEAVVPEYLADVSARARYARFRDHAGR
jgi:NADH dehydrogenase